MLMQLNNRMTKTATKADFTVILDLSDVLQVTIQAPASLRGIVGLAF